MLSAGVANGRGTRGAFVERDGAAGSVPADGREPRPRRHDRDGFTRRRHGSAPTSEPRTRAARVDARGRAEVLPEVQQDVDEPAARLGGRAEGVGMKTAAPQDPTHLLRLDPSCDLPFACGSKRNSLERNSVTNG